MSLSAKDLTLDLAIRYGFQVLGALVILGVGLLLARWVGNLLDGWLAKRALEPPARTLMVRVARVVVMVFTLVVALDKFGFQIAPLVAGIGVAGLGIGIATTSIYTTAGQAVTSRQRNVAFGYLSTAYLMGLAVSPIVAGLIGSRSMRAVFVVDAVGLALITWIVRQRMRAAAARARARCAQLAGRTCPPPPPAAPSRRTPCCIR